MKQLFSLLIILTFISCEPEEPTISDGEIFATDIELYPKEVYARNEQGLPILKLILQTSDIYPCYNYKIDFSKSFEKDELTILVNNIYKPDICLTALGPAIGTLELPETTRELKIVRGDQTDTYDVNINAEQIEILPRTTEFTDLVNPITFRYPENSFAVVCGTNLDQTELCANFLEKLDDVQSLSSYTFPENGRTPYPDSSSGNWNNTPSRYFIYENETALIEAVEQFEMFTYQNLSPDDGNSLSIITWDNQSYYSYQLLE